LPGPGLRPTPDRVRETLFNWLGGDVRGARCLDLFAGSGALGIEAMSRGAAGLTAVERHCGAAGRLSENLTLLGVAGAEVLQQDVLRLLKSGPTAPYDIVFADPPFAADIVGQVCCLLASANWLASDAWVYLEQDAQSTWPPLPEGWEVHREGRAGQSAFRLLRCNKSG
jgi:16S rRNA (guanine966-N2)-methyltransferase